MVYVIVIALAFWVMFYGITVLIAQMETAHDFTTASTKFDIAKKNAENSAIELNTQVNSNGNDEDRLSCSGGIITCSGSGGSCSSNQWALAPDGIADSCDNDDGLPDYWTGNVTNLLSASSKLSDDDDAARLTKIGFVPPGEEVVAFVMNSKIANTINLNSLNIEWGSRQLPQTGAFLLRIKTSSGSGTVTLRKIDKTRYDQTASITELEKRTGGISVPDGILSSSGEVNGGNSPYFFDAATYDYIVTLENPTLTTPYFFEVTAHAGEKSVYIVPLEQVGETLRLLPHPYFGSVLK